MTYLITQNVEILDLLFAAEETPSLRNRYNFWQAVGNHINNDTAYAVKLDSNLVWMYQVNVVDGTIVIFEKK